MKKLLFLVTALLAMVQQSSAQTTPVITVADVEAEPGETVTFRLNLSGGKVEQYTALQFDAQFPATGFSTTGVSTVNSSWSVETKIVGDVGANGVAIVAFASSNTIPTADVENLVAVKFQVNENVVPGDYNVTLNDIELSYGFNSKDRPENVTFKVKVLENRTIKFDESNSYLPDYTAGTTKDVYMKRTIKANEWSTIVLPFTLNKSKAEAAFGTDAQLADFNGFEVNFGDGNIPLGINIDFSSYNIKAMQGGKPYLIKTTSDIESFEASGVKLVDAVTDVSKEYEKDDNFFSGKMTGTLVKSVIPADGLFISGNKFWYSTGKTNVKAFRCWFELDAVLGEETDFGARVFLNFQDEGTTGINNHYSKTTANNSWYTLDGRKLDKKPTEKGVYVRDGRKVVIK